MRERRKGREEKKKEEDLQALISNIPEGKMY